jgi:hypothetical protein
VLVMSMKGGRVTYALRIRRRRPSRLGRRYQMGCLEV